MPRFSPKKLPALKRATMGGWHWGGGPLRFPPLRCGCFEKYDFLPPKSSILIRFSIINHPFWGFSHNFWKHPCGPTCCSCHTCSFQGSSWLMPLGHQQVERIGPGEDGSDVTIFWIFNLWYPVVVLCLLIYYNLFWLKDIHRVFHEVCFFELFL